MREELASIGALCDADFVEVYYCTNGLKKGVSGYTIEWAQQAYNRSQWEGEANEFE